MTAQAHSAACKARDPFLLERVRLATTLASGRAAQAARFVIGVCGVLGFIALYPIQQSLRH